MQYKGKVIYPKVCSRARNYMMVEAQLMRPGSAIMEIATKTVRHLQELLKLSLILKIVRRLQTYKFTVGL
jgi:hypothetical protein